MSAPPLGVPSHPARSQASNSGGECRRPHRVSSLSGVVLPEWGLTRAQIEAGPWELAPDVLRPLKKITDPIHGEIYLTALEVAVLDSKPMQRLRRVRQLGTTHLVYPGATHTRFSHSLGALRVAQDLMDVALAQGLGPHPVEDLFREWQSKFPRKYERMVGEATVLARLGALLHDLGHVPFGHTLEEDLGILQRHDENEPRFEGLWHDVLSDLQERRDLAPGGIILPEDLAEQLKPADPLRVEAGGGDRSEVPLRRRHRRQPQSAPI